MPQRNTVGGKAYKKNKKGLGTNDKDGGNQRFIAKSEGQDYGRVTRLLGNRRVLCFCNDGLDRVCKIRGGICRGSHNRQKIDTGDIVLISYREYTVKGGDIESNSDVEEEDILDQGRTPDKVIAVSNGTGSEGTEAAAAAILRSGKKDIADILMKYDRTHWRDIRKEGNIHRMLFPTTATSSHYAADDIFEDVGDEEQEETATATSKNAQMFLDTEDLVIDEI